MGSEGVVGLPAFLGSNIAFSRALVPSAGPALRIKAEAFRSEVGRDSTLHHLLQRSHKAVQTLSGIEGQRTHQQVGISGFL